MTAPSKQIYYIEVLGKALKVLDVFVHLDKPRLTLQEITEHSKLSKNTVFRILYTLTEHGYVVKHSTEYELAANRLKRRDLRTLATPFMDALRDQFDETVNLGILDGSQIRYIEVRESRARFRLAERIGGTDFLHCTALGKSHLAFLPFKTAAALLKQSGMPRLTEHTITTAPKMKGELAAIHQQGYAVDNQESMLGAYCVGVPILDAAGAPAAALSVSGPTVRFNQTALPQVSRALLDAATQIGRLSGRNR
jgi:DNA-binding IclR family transcriptional regulator